MKITATMKGVPDLIRKLKDVNEGGGRIAKAIIQSAGDEIANEAKSLAPKDLGTIAQNIFRESANLGFQAIVTANAPESAFQEFGTGAQVDIPEGMENIASQFKGGGETTGTWEEFLKAMIEWVKRHGITGVYSVKTRKRSSSKSTKLANQLGSDTDNLDEQAAYLIARAILSRGLKPKPFMYPAWLKVAPRVPERLETALKEYLNEKSE
jgi:HK97 gp10 family phage protein